MSVENFNRFNDEFTKYIFANDGQKEFLLDLLNAVFDECKLDCVPNKITDVTYKDRELMTFHVNEKVGRLDVYGQASEGQIIDIEFQCKVDKTIVDRNLFYFSKILSTQDLQSKSYDEAQPVIIINMLKENFFLEGCDYITVAGLTAQQSNNLLPNKLLSNKLNFIYIEARKCVKQSEQNPSRLAQWMTYLRSTSDDVIENLAKGDKLFKKVLEAERKFRGDTHMMNTYSNIERLENRVASLEDKTSLLESKKAELESENASLKQEVARAKLEEALKNAKNMLAKGLPRSLVKEITELSDNQLAALG